MYNAYFIYNKRWIHYQGNDGLHFKVNGFVDYKKKLWLYVKTKDKLVY